MQPVIDYFANNHDAVWYVVGGIMLIVEAKILGLSTGILLFTGLGAMLTGFAVSVGWATAIETEIMVFGVVTVVVTALLWKPFKSLQKTSNTKDTSSDMLGMVVELSSEVTKNKSGTVNWSGVPWKAVLDKSCKVDSIQAGSEVKITSVSVGRMTIEPV